jgi:Lrp/AsnC family transcriptional regulator for asnA, asnC and gidA
MMAMSGIGKAMQRIDDIRQISPVIGDIRPSDCPHDDNRIYWMGARPLREGTRMEQPDELDRQIISQLQYDGRKAYTDIAREMGISEAAVRRRVKHLVEGGMLQIVGIAEPQFLGFSEAAFIGVNVQSSLSDRVIEQIQSFPEVTYLFQAAGEFDLFIEVYCRDRADFVAFLNERLRQVDGVERTQTFMILKMHKLSYRWGQAAG